MSRRTDAQSRCDKAAALLDAGRFEAALPELQTAAALDPDLVGAHLGFAIAYRNLNLWAEAEAAARNAVQADPKAAAPAHYLGVLLVELGRSGEALPYLEAAAARGADNARYHRDLAVTRLFLGDIIGGRKALVRTLELDPAANEALYTLGRLTDLASPSPAADRAVAAIANLEGAAGLEPALKAQLLFTRAKQVQDRGDAAGAVETLGQANAARRGLSSYDVATDEAQMAAIAAVFGAERLAALAGQGAASDRPIFIVGLPRCGSTLVEQMLAAHPDVHGAGELHVLTPMLERATGENGVPYPAWAETMNGADCEMIGESYLSRIPVGLPGKTRTTDKWLENFRHLGLLAACLPNARVVHCRRDPRDQLLSCWSMLFSQEQEFVYDLEDLARYHRAYQALMAHWRRVLPAGFMLEVRYEALVAEPEAGLRRLLNHCGLAWDDAPLRFWEARRAVKSASLHQVREPLHDRSVGRWREYQAELGDFFERIAADDAP